MIATIAVNTTREAALATQITEINDILCSAVAKEATDAGQTIATTQLADPERLAREVWLVIEDPSVRQRDRHLPNPI